MSHRAAASLLAAAAFPAALACASWAAQPAVSPAASPAPSLAAASSTAPAPGAPVRTVEGEIAGVIDLFYDFQPFDALAAADGIERRHPGHPAGPFYKAIVSYQRSLFEDPVRAETLSEFERHADRCVAAAEAWMSTSPATGHYYLGAALGFRARVRAHSSRLREALSDARKAVGHIKKALEDDASLEDAYLGLGLYNYFGSRLPAAAKPFAFIMTGMWPNRERGLEQLVRASEKGTVAAVEARTVLASVYASDREKRWKEAGEILSALMARYPRNPTFRMRRIYLAQREGRWDDALALADPKGEWVSDLSGEVQPATLAMARYRAAETLILAGRPDEARPLLASLERMLWLPNLKPWIALRRGNLLQLDGAGEEAREAYLSITEARARKLADLYMAEPYPKGPKTPAPLRWPVSEVPR